MSLADELKKLDNLHLSGALSEDEFRQAKRALLYQPAPPAEEVQEQTALPNPAEFNLRTLSRSRLDSWFGGVCGGLGARGPLPSWAWRVLFALSVLAWGVGLLPYILLWMFIPSEPTVESES